MANYYRFVHGARSHAYDENLIEDARLVIEERKQHVNSVISKSIL